MLEPWIMDEKRLGILALDLSREFIDPLGPLLVPNVVFDQIRQRRCEGLADGLRFRLICKLKLPRAVFPLTVDNQDLAVGEYVPLHGAGD